MPCAAGNAENRYDILLRLVLQATLKADVTYFFVVDGFDGAYGVWQFTLEALDNSTVEGSLLSGPYGLAVAGTSSTNTTSESLLHTLLL